MFISEKPSAQAIKCGIKLFVQFFLAGPVVSGTAPDDLI
jgi:hypothetical protein